MKTLLGLPVRSAIQRLEAQGASYTLVKTEEPKKSLHGTDERVVRVKNKMVLFSLRQAPLEQNRKNKLLIISRRVFLWEIIAKGRNTMSQMRGPLPKGFEPFEIQRMPKHVAIIMDGNGRWAKQRGKNAYHRPSGRDGADGEYCTRQF